MYWFSENLYRYVPLLSFVVSAMAVVIGYRSRSAIRGGQTYLSTPLKISAVILALISCCVLVQLIVHYT